MSRVIIIGDVHGCLAETEKLLRKINYRPEERLIFAGDLLDRGPDPVGVVRLVRRIGAECVMGNHEEKHVRWAAWEAKRASGEYKKKNPMHKFDPVRQGEHDALTIEEKQWLGSLPVFIRFESGGKPFVVVHGGFETSRPIEEQSMSRCCRLRYLDENGDYFSTGDPLDEVGTVWSEVWGGPETVFYGHAVHGLEGPRIDRCPNGAACYGLDTGAVFGGRLTAAVVEDGVITIEQVQAAKEYFPMRKYQRRPIE